MISEEIVSRLVTLDRSLGEFEANDFASWQLAAIFNALLNESKKVIGEDPIVWVIEPVGQSASPTSSTATCGTIRGSIGQLISALG